MDLPEILEALAGACENEPLRFGYVFGSVARTGTGRDLDVAVMPVHGLSPRQILDLTTRLSMTIGERTGFDRVDVVSIPGLPLTLRAAIAREGRLAFSRDEPARVGFERDTLIEYEDYQPYNERLRTAFARRLRLGMPHG